MNAINTDDTTHLTCSHYTGYCGEWWHRSSLSLTPMLRYISAPTSRYRPTYYIILFSQCRTNKYLIIFKERSVWFQYFLTQTWAVFILDRVMERKQYMLYLSIVHPICIVPHLNTILVCLEGLSRYLLSVNLQIFIEICAINFLIL